jgi:Ser/Thr protein kinase RdoA (MazF antagonist)
MEDLAAARFGDAAAGWSLHDARLVVDALAALHATWWNDPKLDQWDWLPPFGDASEQLEKLAGRRAVFLERHGQDVSSDLRRLTMSLGSAHAELIGRLCRSPRTLLHGDTHLDNIAFIDGVAAVPVFFDWQSVAKGVCVVDLALFLSSGSTEQRRMHERRLIEQYHTRLAASGVRSYSLETLMADYVVALVRWWIGTVNGLGSSHAGGWAGRQAQLARQSVQRWNGLTADHALLNLIELT